MIRDVAFIVIARNESFAVGKALEALAGMSMSHCQVICVDSDSTDDTQKVMRSYADQFENFSLVLVEGLRNAAIARNAGLRHVKQGRHVFFLDGDIALNEQFLEFALMFIQEGIAAAVTGGLAEMVYTDDYKDVIKHVENRYSHRSSSVLSFCGGNYLLSSSIVNKIGFFNEKLVRLEDVEFSSRISRWGHIVNLPLPMGTHHTLSYGARPLDFFKRKYPTYHGLFLRSRIRDRILVKQFLREFNYPLFAAVLLILAGISAMVGLIIGSVLVWILPLLFFLMDMIHSYLKGQLPKKMVYHYLWSVWFAVGFVFKWSPRGKGESYIRLLVDSEAAV